MSTPKLSVKQSYRKGNSGPSLECTPVQYPTTTAQLLLSEFLSHPIATSNTQSSNVFSTSYSATTTRTSPCSNCGILPPKRRPPPVPESANFCSSRCFTNTASVITASRMSAHIPFTAPVCSSTIRRKTKATTPVQPPSWCSRNPRLYDAYLRAVSPKLSRSGSISSACSGCGSPRPTFLPTSVSFSFRPSSPMAKARCSSPIRRKYSSEGSPVAPPASSVRYASPRNMTTEYFHTTAPSCTVRRCR